MKGLKYRGTAASSGIAVGRLRFLKMDKEKIPFYTVSDTDGEILRYENAVRLAEAELKKLYDETVARAGEDSAEIFSIHRMMLDDPDFDSAVKLNISEMKMNGESAVKEAADSFIKLLTETGNAYLMARGSDIRDISERVINILLGKKDFAELIDEECVIYTDDLTPSEAMKLDKSKILAFLTAYGSQNSHTAILARMSGMPCIVSCGEISQEADGKYVVLDGGTGEYETEPSEETLRYYRGLMEERRQSRERLKELKGLSAITSDGRNIMLYANIGNLSDVKAVKENGADGIGLFRTEFIFMERESLPSEEEQLEIYRDVARQMEGKRVIIRTLDIGADKSVEYLKLPKEENPALGLRGIRLCLYKTELFKSQLRAVLRASAFGKIAVMFPMIASVFEITEVKKIINEVKDELERDKIDFDRSLEIGIMVETPAAAVCSDLLAEEVDFFSIGTNDLTQYTLAADRQNPAASRYYRQDSEAVLRLIRTVCKNAHKAGIWVGICGEISSDPEMTEKLLECGADELSVSPPMILPVKERIRAL